MNTLRQYVLTTLISVSLLGAAQAQDTLQSDVDQSFEAVSSAVTSAGLEAVLEIDHARLADAEGVDMPPSRVQLFSDPRINAAFLKQEIRSGLDLPFRVLSYGSNGTAALSYTPASFLARRHELASSPELSAFDARLADVFAQIEDIVPQHAATDGVNPDFAILELESRHDVAETVARLKQAITAQPDTVWFGEIDFQQEAGDVGVALKPAELLLFGGPAPGGVAMAEFPAIGLDAFCQKLLVYADDNGKTVVLFNDIAALAELHYGRSIEPHALLNKRLTQTFASAIR